MKRFYILLGVTLIVLLAAPAAPAASWLNSLTSDVLNTFEDQSRESLFDLGDGQGGAPDNAFNVGDVIIAFLRIDDKIVPNAQSFPNGTEAYAVISQQVASRVTVTVDTNGDAVPDTQIDSFTFVPTTVVGLRLQDLLPTLVGPVATAGDVAALVEDIATDLINASPGDGNLNLQLDMQDFMMEIDSTGTLDFTAGFTGADPDNFFSTIANTPGIDVGNVSINDNLAALDTTTLSTPVGATFDLGLSVLFNPNAPLVTYADMVPVVDPLDIGNSPKFNQVGVTNGNTSGASDVQYTDAGLGTVSNVFSNGFGIFPNANVLGSADNANVSVVPNIIPEPQSLAVWGLLLVGLGGWRMRRRRK